jgi:hypothetical protein
MLQHELAAAFDRGEQLAAAGLPFEPPKIPLASDELQRLGRFLAWAKERCCRACPARPAVVAAYVLHEHAKGTPAEQVLALLRAIEAFHDHHGLANPCATAVVRLALDDVIRVEPPRSWPKEDKILFANLDPAVRDVIARRETERETALRRAQNALAEEKKRLLADSAEKSVGNTDKEPNNHVHS